MEENLIQRYRACAKFIFPTFGKKSSSSSRINEMKTRGKFVELNSDHKDSDWLITNTERKKQKTYTRERSKAKRKYNIQEHRMHD